MKLVNKCLKIKSNFFKRLTHSLKLKHMNEKLLRFFQIRDIKQRPVEMNRVIEAIALDMKSFSNNNSLMSRSESIEREKLGWRVPTLPRGIVAFEKPLENLKARVLPDSMDCDDDDGFDDASVVVVSAPGGCGKTTLVTMLCYDDQIRGNPSHSSINCFNFGQRV